MFYTELYYSNKSARIYSHSSWGRRCRDCMVVGFTTTCAISAISAYHHWSCEFESHSWQVVLNTTLCDKVC